MHNLPFFLHKPLLVLRLFCATAHTPRSALKGAARLVVTVMEDSRLRGSVMVGAASRPLSDLLPAAKLPASGSSPGGGGLGGGPSPGEAWSGWLPLTVAPEESKGGKMTGAALAGALVGGPLGAAAGAASILLWNKAARGRVALDLAYYPIARWQRDRLGLSLPSSGAPQAQAQASAQAPAQAPAQAQGPSALLEALKSLPAAAAGVIPVGSLGPPRGAGGGGAGGSGAPPKGGTPGLDWGDLSREVGVARSAAAFEFCAFVEATTTDTQVVLSAGSISTREQNALFFGFLFPDHLFGSCTRALQASTSTFLLIWE